jgi:hypothetical protein
MRTQAYASMAAAAWLASSSLLPHQMREQAEKERGQRMTPPLLQLLVPLKSPGASAHLHRRKKS